MLSKREIKEKYEGFLAEKNIRRDSNETTFAHSCFEKSRHNLEIASLLNILSTDASKKQAIQISPNAQYFDWVIIAAYYSMYMAATSALAKVGIKCTTHGATVTALEYVYCVEQRVLERKYIDMIQRVELARSDVQMVSDAMQSRVAVQYTTSTKYGAAEAKRVLKNARDFVGKISEIFEQ